MNNNVQDGHCPVSWCDEGKRLHTRHERTMGTWIGSTVTAVRAGTSTTQLVIYGGSDADPRPVLVMVGPGVTMRQIDCELSWVQLAELAGALSLALVKYGLPG